MADRTELVIGDDHPSIVERTPQQRIRRRLDDDQARLRVAMARVKQAARELTPAARIRHDPYPWVLGAFATGLVLGWLTAPRQQ